jgi:hypothetical protein
MSAPTHYCITRSDLPLGMMGASLVHAAGESAALFGAPLPPHTNVVCLATRHEAQLLQVEQALSRKGVPHVAIREPDEPWENALMAIGLVPVTDRSFVHPVTRKLQLLR